MVVRGGPSLLVLARGGSRWLAVVIPHSAVPSEAAGPGVALGRTHDDHMGHGHGASAWGRGMAMAARASVNGALQHGCPQARDDPPCSLLRLLTVTPVLKLYSLGRRSRLSPERMADLVSRRFIS